MPCVWKKSVNDFSLTNFKETIRFFFQSSFSACSFPLSFLCLQRYKWGSLSLTAPVARVLTHSSVNTEGRADRCHLLASLSQVLTTLISNSTVNLQVAWKLDSIPPFVNTITVFCANICFIKFNIRVLKNAAYSLIYLKMHIKCANVPNSTPFKSCYRLLGFTMRNLGAYPRKVAASSQAPWPALNVKQSTGRLVLTEVQYRTRGGGTHSSQCGHVPSPGIYHSCLHVKWLY